jgi:hypothetical protein
LAQKKPASVPQVSAAKEFDPFIPPYVPGLYVDELVESGEEYTVLVRRMTSVFAGVSMDVAIP